MKITKVELYTPSNIINSNHKYRADITIDDVFIVSAINVFVYEDNHIKAFLPCFRTKRGKCFSYVFFKDSEFLKEIDKAVEQEILKLNLH
ncbi:hypothetical protein [Pectinatus sottacetonis]|uniref:hypothetical protein n=1 Tax=Pectinatus sottacetonis TaxID=1002795 RepID=UPI0018C5469D|nr:hypothetical protein [Pectinatus sottacetonis]